MGRPGRRRRICWGRSETPAGRERLKARASAPYRRWEARSWAPSGGRGRTQTGSAPRAAAAAGKARPEAARGSGGAAQPGPASLAPPGCWVGRVQQPSLRAGWRGPRPHSGPLGRTRPELRDPATRFTPSNGTNDGSLSSSSQSELSRGRTKEQSGRCHWQEWPVCSRC